MLCCRYCRKIQILIIYPCVKTTYHAVLISEAIAHSPVSDLELFLTKDTAFSHFWDQNMCLRVYGSAWILTYRKHTRLIQLFKNPICEWTLGHHFLPKYWFQPFFEDEINIHVSNEVTGCSEIKGKTKRGIQSTSKMVQNRLKYINTFQGV